jgi:hypothetical protein
MIRPSHANASIEASCYELPSSTPQITERRGLAGAALASLRSRALLSACLGLDRRR